MYRDNSAEHKGLFLLPFLSIGTVTVARLSTDGEVLTASPVAQVRATLSFSSLLGIAKQYVLVA